MALIGLLVLACGLRGAPTREEVQSAIGFALPPSARQLQLRNINVGLRDSRTEASFDIDPVDRADFGARSGCLLVSGENTANCLSRRLHTEQTITITNDGGWDHVSIETAEYDNCLFEGCPNPLMPPPLTPAQATNGLSAACATERLAVQTQGQLTIGTDKPGYPPYVIDGDPSNGKGFESAVAYAVAHKLGFTREQVRWKVVPFNASYRPGGKDFDFDINQISINEDRRKAVDLSEPYYTAAQAIVATEGSKIANATARSDLSGAALGAQVGTTSLSAAKSLPGVRLAVFDQTDAAVAALKSKQIDGIVVDLPTALYLSSAVLEGGKVVGQFPAEGGDQWGVLLEKGSALTPCVNEALAALVSDGMLGQITEQWMGAATAPALQ